MAPETISPYSKVDHPRGKKRTNPIQQIGHNLLKHGETTISPHDSRSQFEHELSHYRMELSSFEARMQRVHLLSVPDDPALLSQALKEKRMPAPTAQELDKLQALGPNQKMDLSLGSKLHSVHHSENQYHLYTEPLKDIVIELAKLLTYISEVHRNTPKDSETQEQFRLWARHKLNPLGLDVRKVLPYLALTQPHGKLKTFSALVNLAKETELSGDLAVREAIGIRHILNEFAKLPAEEVKPKQDIDPMAD